MNRILVIEDDKFVRSNTVDLLKEEGYEVFEADNGRAGIDIAKESIPDLIISDIMMPEIDGYGVLNELQKDVLTSSIPFIFLSAKTGYNDIRSGMNIGADDYITKPFRTSDLLKAINTRISKSKHLDNKFNEMYDRITKYLPHELRTPLVAILGFSEILKDNFDELSKQEILDMIENVHHGGGRLYKHIEKFLYYSELEAFLIDKTQIAAIKHFYSNSVSKIIYNKIIKTAEIFGRRSDLMIDIQDGSIQIFQKHLEAAVSEIIENSCKFSANGSPITVYSLVEDNKYILTFTDSGKGMTNDQIKNIWVLKQFDREGFDQSGLGLGLSIVHNIMKLYNGTLKINSKPGLYTIVQIEFPNYNISNRQHGG